MTTGDDEANAVMERFALSGVPTYVVLRPDGSEHDRLHGFVTVERMRKALETLAPRPASAEARG